MSILQRSIKSFIFALVVLRITGRKSISQLNYFDFFALSMIGGLFSSYISDPKQSAKIFLAPVAIITLDLLADRAAIKSRSARMLLEGKPVVFIRDGKIIEENITRMHYNIAEVIAALRCQGIYNLNDVEFAVLEVNGKISVLKKSQQNPLTPKDMNIPTQYQGLSSVVISDGKVLSENLRNNNLDFKWLEGKLKEKGVVDISRVFLASLASDGSIYIDLKQNSPSNSFSVQPT